MNLKVYLFIALLLLKYVNILNASNSYDPVNYIVLDDAEDGAPSKGYTGNVSNVYDELRGSRVTFIETGSAYLYKQSYWDPTSDHVEWSIPAKGIGWAIRSNQDFEFKVKIQTDYGVRYLVYYSSATDKTDNSPYFYFNLGTTYQDGNWHDIIKDMETDLDSKESGNHVQNVSYVAIITVTNAAIDDIRAYPADTGAGDITPPEIHVNGSNNIDITQGTTYSELGAYATDNVTVSSSMTVSIDASELNVNSPGMYRIKYDVQDGAGNAAKTVYRVINVREPGIIIGARTVYSTPVELGTVFISPSGSGDGSSADNTIGWDEFLNGKWKDIEAGDVVFFRGGTYNFTTSLPGWNLNEGKKNQPIIFESYPGETAVFDGSIVDSLDIHAHNGNVTLYGNYIWLRKVEFNRLPHWGPRIWGARCIIEGVSSHHNLLSGLEVSWGFNTFESIIRDNNLYENSDLDISPSGGANGDLYDEYNLGGNADGVTLHSGTMNILTHNTVYENSDDGMDTWDGNLTVFSYNYVGHEGKASYKGHGDGGGLKLGSGTNYGTQVFHNITYEINFEYGGYVPAIKNNASTSAVMSYNTLHKSKYSIDYVPSSRIYRNILLRATHGLMNTAGDPMPAPTDTIDNSFNMIPAFLNPDYSTSIADYCDDAESRMLSIDPNSTDFLQPDPNDIFANIGAYADDDALPDIIPPTVFPYGNTTVNIPKGALYIEHGAFAYDAKDGMLPVTIWGHIDSTDIDATYLIKYIATDAAGNSSSYTREVVVGAGGTAVGIKDNPNEESDIDVFPNPSTGVINVRLNNCNSNDIIIRVIDITGSVISTHTAYDASKSFNTQLNLSNLPKGNYIIYIVDGKQLYSKKIILIK